MRLPRTWGGWGKLFWLTLRRCPWCHAKCIRDRWIWDRGDMWCVACGFLAWPRGAIRALIANAEGRL